MKMCRLFATPTRSVLPDVVSLAVSLPVAHEAGAGLVEELMAFGALKARGVPLQVRRHAEDVLIVDLRPAAHAQAEPPLLCNNQRQ